MIDPIDLRDDFSCSGVVPSLIRLLECDTPAPDDAVLLEPGEPPRVMPRAELLAHLRACGMHAVAKRAERFELRAGEVLGLVVTDHGVRAVTLPLPDWDAHTLPPRAHVSHVVLGLLHTKGLDQ